MKADAIVVAPELNEFGRRCIADLLELPELARIVFVPDEPVEGLDERVICVPSGTEATTGRKRQIGLEHAESDLVALIDDDAYPHRSWLRVAVGAFREDGEVVAVAGPTLTPPDDGELEHAGGRVYGSLLVSGPERWRYGFQSPRQIDDAPSVNLVLRREDAVAAGGLDSGDRWGEDTIVCQRLIDRGGKLRYEPGAVVYHSRRPLWRPHLRQLYRWSRHRSAYVRQIGGNSRRPAYFAPSALVIGAVGGLPIRGRLRKLHRAGLGAYLLCCIVAGADRDPRRWIRVSAGIAATHFVYGTGFIQGLAGMRPPR